MDTLSGAQQLVALIVGVFLLLGILAGMIVFLRTSIDKGTIEVFRESNAALKEADEIKTKQIEDLRGRVQRLERENELLLQQRPSAQAIADLTAMLQEHHHETVSYHTETISLLKPPKKEG
jgi:hypothetical protein